MKYFQNCKTIDEVKALYKKLALKLHPDCNEQDTTKEFVEMSAEYEKAFKMYKNTFKNASGETYTKENDETAEQYKDIIDKIIHFEGVKIEIIGTWIWLSENTYAYKEQIKELGFKWSKNKQAWSFHTEPWRKRSKRNISLDEIRGLYGTSEIKTRVQPRLAY